MNTDQHGLMQEQLTEQIIKAFFEVYNELGHGFLESVYESAMEIALRDMNLRVERQVATPVSFRTRRVGDFRADMIVEGSVILEFKAARAVEPGFEAQLLN